MISVKISILYTQFNGYQNKQKMAEQMCRIRAEQTVGDQIDALLAFLANERGEVYDSPMCLMRDCEGQTLDEGRSIEDGRAYEMDIEVAFD
ncbi:hypothetical protein GPALN_005075 [Globodera pallida]|nr:hypothetical protein GPALN_005075 [Globodera pallida]